MHVLNYGDAYVGAYIGGQGMPLKNNRIMYGYGASIIKMEVIVVLSFARSLPKRNPGQKQTCTTSCAGCIAGLPAGAADSCVGCIAGLHGFLGRGLRRGLALVNRSRDHIFCTFSWFKASHSHKT